MLNRIVAAGLAGTMIVAATPAAAQSQYFGGRGERASIQQCVSAVEGRYRGRTVNVTDVRAVDRSAKGFNVRGRILVDNRWNNGRARWQNSAYGSRWDDAGSFVCRVQYGRIAAIDYNGVRGLR